ncbi:MAG: thioredoxin family protein [Gammaproteobacteria bacterium]
MQRRIALLTIVASQFFFTPAVAGVTDIHCALELNALLSTRADALLYFTVEGCAPCQRASVVIDSFAANNEQMSVLEIDLEANEIGKRYGVVVAPALVVLVDGKPIGAPYYITSTEILEADIAALGVTFARSMNRSIVTKVK